MSIPADKELRLPALEAMADGKERHRTEIFDCLDKKFQFSEEDKRQKTASDDFRLVKRMVWALSILKNADLLESTAWGYYKITEKGQEVLKEKPSIISKEILLRYAPADSKFFHPPKKDKKPINNEYESDKNLESSQTPIELIEENYQVLKNSLSNELLRNIKKRDPGFFEKLVIDLLIAMGYGGSRKEAGEAIGKSHDGGIDGIIKEDKLGLDIIYLQAKRYDSGTIGSPQIRHFIGALTEKHAQKGIFITTTSYTTQARECVKNIRQKIILIDGDELLRLMIENNVGVSKDLTFEIKKIDLDYFE